MDAVLLPLPNNKANPMPRMAKRQHHKITHFFLKHFQRVQNSTTKVVLTGRSQDESVIIANKIKGPGRTIATTEVLAGRQGGKQKKL
jgi:hypothetical protein